MAEMALNLLKMSIKARLKIYLALLLVHSLTGQLRLTIRVEHIIILCLHPTDEGLGFLADATIVNCRGIQ